jgi:hypothetical protein
MGWMTMAAIIVPCQRSFLFTTQTTREMMDVVPTNTVVAIPTNIKLNTGNILSIVYGLHHCHHHHHHGSHDPNKTERAERTE